MTDELKTLLAGVNVLLVEDDDDSREVLAAFITNSGGSVTTAASVEEALSVLRVSKPDVIVSDIWLGDFDDGNRFMREVRASGHAAIPAIAISGHSSEDAFRCALEAGFDSFLAKPVMMGRLVEAIALAATGGRTGAASASRWRLHR